MPAKERAHVPPSLRDFIRRFREDILREWRTAALGISAARDLGPVALVDHIPELLDQIADIPEVIANGGAEQPAFGSATRHALDRLADGFDVSAVVKELSLLRGCMLAIWDHEHFDAPLSELRALDLAIDDAIAASVARYAEARARTLAGIDRISTTMLEPAKLDELLHRLLAAFKDTTPSVDVAAIILVEGDHLRSRATVGMEDDVSADFTLRMGEGFAGRIAAEQRALHVKAAHNDPMIKSDLIRWLGIRGMYGVPLMHDGRLIGVAHMGSLHAAEFSDEDRMLFDSLAARATVAIAHHTLRHELASSERGFKHLASERERALAKLESLLAASPVGIAFLDPELRYLRINEALAQLNGRPVADHIGKHIRDMIPDAVEHLEPLLRQVLESGSSVRNIEIAVRHPGTGQRLWLLENFFPVRGQSGTIRGVGGIIVDVTEAKLAHEALRSEQATLQSIIDHAPAAIWVKDRQGRIVIANRRLADALGVDYKKVVGKRSDEILPMEIAREHQEHDEQVLRENRAIEVEEEAPGPSGVKTFLSIKFPIPGGPPLVGAIAAEITHRKRAERELEAAVEMREDLLSVVSHDLRSPLATVQLSASLLLSQLGGDQRARRHLEMIARSCTRMESLIGDLLDTAMLRAGRFQLELQRESIDNVVTEAIELHMPLASEKGIALSREGSVDGIYVMCDRDRILQVFSNLIGNAIKFCRPGDTIKIRTRRDGADVRFCVEDSGPGIPKAALDRLFEPYWSSPEHAAQGSGLGLYIVRGIVESHRGRAWAESEPGSGARLIFTLPIAAE
jgi:PAS domain S-box-containing protein